VYFKSLCHPYVDTSVNFGIEDISGVTFWLCCVC